MQTKNFTEKIKIIFKRGSLVFFFSFFLNFFWESIHAVLFYEGHSSYLSSYFIKIISYASTIDALIIFIIFSLGCLFFGKTCWLENYKFKEASFTIILGIIIAAIIETKALIFNQWIYNEIMPTILGIGLSPLVQLAITGVLSIFLTSKIIKSKED